MDLRCPQLSVQFGAKDRPVVPSLGMAVSRYTGTGHHMQFDVDVKMIILNNNFLGMVRQWQGISRQAVFCKYHRPDFVM